MNYNFLKKIDNKTNKFLIILGVIVFTLYAILMSIPWLPKSFSHGLDDSFLVVLHKIFGTDIQFGKDFIYTYGPYGILQSNFYFPETYHYLIAGRILIAITYVCGLAKIIIHCWNKDRISVIFLLPFLAYFINSGMEINAFYFTVVFLPLVIYFYVTQGRITPILLLNLVGVALTSLIKQSYFSIALALIALISIDEVFRRRRLPIVMICYLSFILIFWVLAGQNPLNISAYLSNGKQIIKGFQEAMSSPGQNIYDIFWFLLSTVTFIILTLATVWKYQRKFNLLVVLGLVLFYFVIFRASFIRHDHQHAILSGHATIPVACLITALIWTEIKNINIRIRPLKSYIPVIIFTWFLLITNASYIFSNYSYSNDFFLRTLLYQ